VLWQAVVIFVKNTGNNNTTGDLSKCTMPQERSGVSEHRKGEMQSQLRKMNDV
jgi:hypothetical protein